MASNATQHIGKIDTENLSVSVFLSGSLFHPRFLSLSLFHSRSLSLSLVSHAKSKQSFGAFQAHTTFNRLEEAVANLYEAKNRTETLVVRVFDKCQKWKRHTLHWILVGNRKDYGTAIIDRWIIDILAITYRAKFDILFHLVFFSIGENVVCGQKCSFFSQT